MVCSSPAGVLIDDQLNTGLIHSGKDKKVATSSRPTRQKARKKLLSSGVLLPGVSDSAKDLCEHYVSHQCACVGPSVGLVDDSQLGWVFMGAYMSETTHFEMVDSTIGLRHFLAVALLDIN